MKVKSAGAGDRDLKHAGNADEGFVDAFEQAQQEDLKPALPEQPGRPASSAMQTKPGAAPTAQAPRAQATALPAPLLSARPVPPKPDEAREDEPRKPKAGTDAQASQATASGSESARAPSPPAQLAPQPAQVEQAVFARVRTAAKPAASTAGTVHGQAAAGEEKPPAAGSVTAKASGQKPSSAQPSSDDDAAEAPRAARQAAPEANTAKPAGADKEHLAAKAEPATEAVTLKLQEQPAAKPAHVAIQLLALEAAPAKAVVAPAPAAARIDELTYDPSLRIDMKPGEARVSLDAGGGLSLLVQVHGGVATIRAEGPAAPLLAQNLPELRAELANNGLSLGGFESGDSRREQPEAESADTPTPAGKPIANASRRSKSRLEVEA
jgi:hypothetical protein